MATFLHTFVHLPGALPPRPNPTHNAIMSAPRLSRQDNSVSAEFYAHDWAYAHDHNRNGHRKGPNYMDNMVHVTAKGDTASTRGCHRDTNIGSPHHL